MLSTPYMTSPIGLSDVRIDVATICPVSPAFSTVTVTPVSAVKASRMPCETRKES